MTPDELRQVLESFQPTMQDRLADSGLTALISVLIVFLTVWIENIVHNSRSQRDTRQRIRNAFMRFLIAEEENKGFHPGHPDHGYGNHTFEAASDLQRTLADHFDDFSEPHQDQARQISLRLLTGLRNRWRPFGKDVKPDEQAVNYSTLITDIKKLSKDFG